MEHSENTENISWKESYRLNKRVLFLLCRESPLLFVSTGIYSTINALIPYLTLYFSAQILNELAAARRVEVLHRQIVILLAVEAVAITIKSLAFRWKNTLSSDLFNYIYQILAKKLLHLDFCTVDDITTYELLDNIVQTERWYGWGLHRIYYHFESFLEAFFKIIGAITLSVSLFTLQVSEHSGRLTLLNKPIFIFLLVFIMTGATILSPYLELLGDKCWDYISEDIKLGNRLEIFYVQKMHQVSDALDMRIYRQDILGMKCHNKSNEFFGTRSKIAKDAKGKMGIDFALAAIVSKIFMGISYVFVCLKAWGGAFGVGSVTQYIGAITSFSQGLSGILKVFGEMKVNSVYLKNILEFLDIPNDMYKGSLTVEKRADRKYEVEFRNVSFQYPHTESYALKNISLKFKIGERLAVVGENGSGKTTFIKLLCRLYDPTEGEILLNGIDIRKYDYREYMNIFSVAFQDFQLLSFPLGENIGSRKNYDRQRAYDCAQKAGLADKIAALPAGLDTCLNKDFDKEGTHVSGGEAQKIAIARALYHDAPFIILDEPTAALDPIAEYEIYTKFDEIVEDRTAIYISHRLSSCRFCDEILVFEQGSVIQQGPHEALLMEQDGKYFELWNAQAQYYTDSPSCI